MLLLPYDKYELQSDKSPEQVMEIIKKDTQIQERLSAGMIRYINSASKHFAGEIGENTFKISRIIIGRNSFLPIIKGTVETDGQGSKTQISMGISPVAAVAVAIALIAAIFAAIRQLFVSEMNSISIEQMLIWLAAGLILYGYTILSYKSEAKRANRRLKEMISPESGDNR